VTRLVKAGENITADVTEHMDMDNVTSDMALLLERARFAIGSAVARVAARQRALQHESHFTDFALLPVACSSSTAVQQAA
jgi:hypothetical protein